MIHYYTIILLYYYTITLLYTIIHYYIHYDTLSYTYTISHCDTPSQQRLNIAASALPSRHCHYLAPPPPSLVVLVAPLPPHSTGCSVHLEGIMLSTSVERAPGKHVKSTGGAAWTSKCNNQTAKSSGGGSDSGSGGGSGSGSRLGESGRGGGAVVAVAADDEITGGIRRISSRTDGRGGWIPCPCSSNIALPPGMRMMSSGLPAMEMA